jgi:hypothetical protein
MTYLVHELGRQSVAFNTKGEAKEFAQQRVDELMADAPKRYRVCKVGSIGRDGDCIMKIGGRQGVNWWSRVTVD